jgi:hypothetical protein
MNKIAMADILQSKQFGSKTWFKELPLTLVLKQCWLALSDLAQWLDNDNKDNSVNQNTYLSIFNYKL